MAKRDAYSRTFPIKIRYRNREVADSSKLNAFEKQVELGFFELERAIGDIYNTENAQNSILSDQPLYINSLGRALGPMADIVPPLSGIEEFSPTLADRLSDATYNVIPHPDQSVKCEIGCKFDQTEGPTSTARTCTKGLLAFYRQQEGAQTGICQTENCPGWSGRDGQSVDSSICSTTAAADTFREYKVVCPPELRSVDSWEVKFYSNAGIAYDKYRIDNGLTGFTTNRSDPSSTYALATNASLVVSGVTEQVRYEYPNLNVTASYIVVMEIPALDTSQTVEVNNVPQATVAGTSLRPTRLFFDLTGLTGSTRLLVTTKPSNSASDAIAAVSQVWIIEKLNSRHRNYNIQLLLPQELDGLSAGTEIPPNFVQLYDTDTNVNRVLDSTRVFATRFNPLDGTLNANSNRDAFDITLFGDQQLEVGNDRYLTVTVGTSVSEAVGALLEAFVEHVSDKDLHITREEACTILADRSFCCDDRLKIDIESLSPATKVAGASPATYTISTFIYGGFPPYTITIDWGDGGTDDTLGIVSGVQTFTLTTDLNPDGGLPATFEHVYSGTGTYTVDFDVADNPDVFGCTASATNLVSPFNVGNPPTIVAEVRQDNFTEYPNFVFTDPAAGYNFITTDEDDFTLNPTFHVLTQIHNTDPEDGKPVKFDWDFNNPDSLQYQFYIENVTLAENETLVISSSSGTLAEDFVQQDSLVLKNLAGTRIYDQDVDYTVDWVSGLVTVVPGGSIADNVSVTARYHHYAYASTLADVSGVNQWVALGGIKSTSTIDLLDFTTNSGVNTIRFKVKE